MKNFKLLLATTAILSTGALMANATDPSVTMTVGVNINRAGTFTKLQDLSFGSVIIPDTAKELHLTMNEGGIVTAPDESVHVLGDAHLGLVEGAPCSLLGFADKIEITSHPGSSAITGNAGDIFCDDTDTHGQHTNRAKFFVEELDITSTEALTSGTYYGDFVITAVYPE